MLGPSITFKIPKVNKKRPESLICGALVGRAVKFSNKFLCKPVYSVKKGCFLLFCCTLPSGYRSGVLEVKQKYPVSCVYPQNALKPAPALGFAGGGREGCVFQLFVMFY